MHADEYAAAYAELTENGNPLPEQFVACPTCRAAINVLCTDEAGAVRIPHKERARAYWRWRCNPERFRTA